MDETLKTAKNCRHYAMCKIDFLGSGVCASGFEKHFVSYYPQGRMMLYEALAQNKIQVTEKCLEIADSCNLCGKCDYQCYFVTELRPVKVMKALKEHVGDYLKNGGSPIHIEDDQLLAEIKSIVGADWASNDPAIRYTYSYDLSPISDPKIPDYVVMPETREQIASLVILFNKYKIPFTVRGNGANLLGFSIHEGVIMDLNRMKTLEFDEKNWLVKAGAGITAFDLQKESKKRGYRINAAEPGALICSNIMGSGVMSTFSTTYGINADNFVDAEFVGKDGSFFSLNDSSSPNLYAYKNLDHKDSPGICTSVSIKLHPVTDDERGILVPFQSLDEALNFTRDCAIRHIGLAIGVLGTEYTSTFFAPTKKLAEEVKEIFINKLKIPYLVVVIGDKFAIRTIREMGFPFIDQRLFKALYLGIPSLYSSEWLGLITELSNDEPYSYLKLNQFNELVETALAPSPELYVKEVDADLRSFFEKLYSRPEMTDLVWLNMFRILSTRVGRVKPFVPALIYLPIDNALIKEMTDHFRTTAEKYQLKSEFGFITPIDNGKRCIYEYDYFFDHNDPEEVQRMKHAAFEANAVIDEYSVNTGVVKGHPYMLHQGFARKENLLYS
jgi:UDP-N-acetylenolpyruvoylglucosamine reductase